MKAPTRPAPEPLELDDVRIVGALTALWVLGGLVLLALDLGGRSVPSWQHLTCVVGVLLGALGLVVVTRRARRPPA